MVRMNALLIEVVMGMMTVVVMVRVETVMR